MLKKGRGKDKKKRKHRLLKTLIGRGALAGSLYGGKRIYKTHIKNKKAIADIFAKAVEEPEDLGKIVDDFSLLKKRYENLDGKIDNIKLLKRRNQLAIQGMKDALRKIYGEDLYRQAARKVKRQRTLTRRALIQREADIRGYDGPMGTIKPSAGYSKVVPAAERKARKEAAKSLAEGAKKRAKDNNVIYSTSNRYARFN